MIQEIFPKHLNNQWVPGKKPEDGDSILHLVKGSILCCTENQQLIYPTYGQVKQQITTGHFVYAFAIDEENFFLLRDNEEIAVEGFGYENIGVYRNCGELDRAYAAISGFHLNNWYNSERFCGRCGKPLEYDEKERAMRCPDCGNIIYPRINPCVIIGIFHNNRILCTQYNRPNAGRFALVAGFTEFGETIEECVQREIMEEVHLKVKNITYYKSQPWGQSSSLLFGFLCEAESEDFHVDGEELASAKWFSREELKECYTPSRVALTSHIITQFMNGEIKPEEIFK